MIDNSDSESDGETNNNEVQQLGKILETVFGDTKADVTFSSINDESLEIQNTKNPMLLSPVIRYVLKFLNIEEIKNCRFVSREWSSIGKVALGNRTQISFYKDVFGLTAPHFLGPVDFYSRFHDSAILFSAFKISCNFKKKSLSDEPFYTQRKGLLGTRKYVSDSRTIEELKNFFDKQQKYIRELTLYFKFSDVETMESIDIGSWISKSPMVRKDTKHMTKLLLAGCGEVLDIPSLHLLAHIKDLTLIDCRINVEAGIKICPVKLELASVKFFQDGIQLKRFRINDIVDFSKTKEISLESRRYGIEEDSTKYVVDMCGNATLDKLILGGCEIINGETSQWVIEHLQTESVPYSLNSEIKIEELFLHDVGSIDLFNLPSTIQKLNLMEIDTVTTLLCSQPIVLENLQYLYIYNGSDHEKDYSFLTHFMNCPKLTHLKLHGHTEVEMKSHWIPKSIKTLTLDRSLINWVDDSYLKLDKVVLQSGISPEKANKFCEAKIQVEDLVIVDIFFEVDQDLVNYLEYRQGFSFGKRLYIGELKWYKQKLNCSVLKDYVDVQSSFYIFESGKMGRAIWEKAFRDIIPKESQ